MSGPPDIKTLAIGMVGGMVAFWVLSKAVDAKVDPVNKNEKDKASVHTTTNGSLMRFERPRDPQGYEPPVPESRLNHRPDGTVKGSRSDIVTTEHLQKQSLRFHTYPNVNVSAV